VQGDPALSSYDPALAYNPRTNQYLAVWAAEVSTADSTKVCGDFSGVKCTRRILGRFIDAAGNPLGSAFGVSDEGPSVASRDTRHDPQVVYNSRDNEFLVVWHGTPTGGGNTLNCGGGEEIFGQRLNATGAEVGSNDFLISARNSGCARDPQVRYSSGSNVYLVAWAEEGGVTPTDQVFAQRVTAAGANTFPLEFQVSTAVAGADPDIAYDSNSDQFLVVWISSGSIMGQRISSLGVPTGLNFAVSDPSDASNAPAATFNSVANEFFVVWDHILGAGTDSAYVVLGQRLSAAGARVGTNDFAISGSQFHKAQHPSVAYDPNANQYQTAFWAATDPSITPDVHGPAFESVFGQQLDATGAKIGTDGFSISATNNDEEARSIVYNTTTCQFLVAWEGITVGDPDADTPTPTKTEIFARRLAAPPCPRAPGGIGGNAAGGGNGGRGPNVTGTGGNGGIAGPCGGGGGAGGGIAGGGGGAGGGGCFAVAGVQSLASGAVVAVAGVATNGSSVQADTLVDIGRSSKGRASRLALVGRTIMRGLRIGRYKVVVRLSAKARRRLKQMRRPKVTLRLKMTAPTGRPLIVTRIVTLKH
jgi:hypothetical protein